MKFSTTLALTLAALATASPVAIPDQTQEVAEAPAVGKRCLLLTLFLLEALKKKTNNNKPAATTAKPITSSTSTSTPCPTTSSTSSTPCPTTSTTSSTSSSSSSSSSSVPAPTPTGPETKREVQANESTLSDLFNFINAASEEDVKQFIHFYKNADSAVVQAWWNGQSVSNDTGLVPSFQASRIHVIAQSAAATATDVVSTAAVETAVAVETVVSYETTYA